MDRINFAIVGCGGAAPPVCQALEQSTLARLTVVHDLNLDLARDLAERYGARIASQLDDVLADPDVQAVYVAVPHDLLYPLARRALEAGKHALVEKPMALDVADVDALIEQAGSSQLALGVFYELRHTPAYARARALLQAGALGEIIGVRIQTVIDKAPYYWQRGYSQRAEGDWRGLAARAGGGIVLMNTSHQLDAIHYVTGLEIVSVTAQLATLVAPVEVEDTAAATLRFSNGAIGSLLAGAHLAGAESGMDERFDLFGTLGQLRVPDAYGDRPLQMFLRQAWGDYAAGVWHALPTPPVSVYREAVDAFARAAQQGQPAPASAHDARRVLAAVRAIYQAAREQRTVSVQ